MTSSVDAIPVSEDPPYGAPVGLPPLDDATPPSLHQEINARRARVENLELLERLRGL